MTVGYTGGTFDLFHVGHLRLLQTAKKMCDFLIVAVSTDDLAESYKDRKPVVSHSDRMEIIKGLSCVDGVVAQNSLDKYEAWKKLKFDILFIGDDWYGRWEEFESKLDIPIMYLPYTEGVSTTILKDKLNGI